MMEEILEIVFRPLTTKLEAVMATVEQLRDSVIAVNAAVENLKSRITDDVAYLRALIEANVQSQEVIDDANARLLSLQSTIGSIDPVPEFPAAPPATPGVPDSPPA